MDEAVVSAKEGGWDVKGFIERVQNDTTFYKAFKTTRLKSYTATNDIKVLNKKGRAKASYYSNSKQIREGNCRSMEFADEKVKGKFYKRNGDYKYYTAELYDYLFFIKEKKCGENDIVAGSMRAENSSTIEQNKYKLKQLIFNPGSKIEGVPLMGNKAAIFNAKIAKMYNFKLTSEKYRGGRLLCFFCHSKG